ncbi:hypothetical protein KIPB_014856, partial [Kipferlia bialata]|eukprot:g14856.t1
MLSPLCLCVGLVLLGCVFAWDEGIASCGYGLYGNLGTGHDSNEDRPVMLNST